MNKIISQRLKLFKEYRLPFLSICSPIRSGGNLLLRLLDGNKQILSYHHEELFGLKSHYFYSNKIINKNRLSNIKFKKSNYLFEKIHLNNKALNNFTKNGYIKSNYNTPIPFIYSKSLHKKLFLKLCKIKCSNKRMLLENYMIGFFNSHLDNQNIYNEKKKFYNNYWPELINQSNDINELLNLNKHSKFLYVVRNPIHWYQSVKYRPFKKEANLDYLNYIWLNGITNIKKFKRKFPNRFIITDYDSLVYDTKKTMINLSKKLNLDFENSMLIPSVNNNEIEANSSFNQFKKKGIVKHNKKIKLSNDEYNYLKKNFLPIYKNFIKSFNK